MRSRIPVGKFVWLKFRYTSPQFSRTPFFNLFLQTNSFFCCSPFSCCFLSPPSFLLRSRMDSNNLLSAPQYAPASAVDELRQELATISSLLQNLVRQQANSAVALSHPPSSGSAPSLSASQIDPAAHSSQSSGIDLTQLLPPVQPSPGFAARQHAALGVPDATQAAVATLMQQASAKVVNNLTSVSTSFDNYAALLPQDSGLPGVDPYESIKIAISAAGKSKRPFKTADDFKDALQAVAEKSVLEGDAHRTAALFKYSSFIYELARDHLDAAQGYHFHVMKAEKEGKFCIISDGPFHPEAYFKFIEPAKFKALSSTATSAPRTSRGTKRYSRDNKPVTPAVGRYPAGSCTHHPAATSHTTAECRSKKKKDE